MQRLLLLIICSLCLACAGCPNSIGSAPRSVSAGPPTIQTINLSDSSEPVPSGEPISLAAAENEWTSFTVQLSNLPSGDRRWLRIHPLQWTGGDTTIPLSSLSASQIVSMPIDLNRAGYVRHTGLSTARRELPRALLPCTISPDGALHLDQIRDPADATDPHSRLGPGSGPVLLWFDMHVPKNAPAGNYSTTIDLMSADQQDPSSEVKVNLSVYGFALPDERHLQMAGQIDWSRLETIYPDEFEAMTPRLVNRRDPIYSGTVKILDDLETIAEAHRVEVVFPQLQPTVKWPANAPPDFDWGDFDPLVTPWLSGQIFADRQPLKFWPLPKDEMVDRYDRKSQLDYWDAVATHFDENDWLASSPMPPEVPTDQPVVGRVNQSDAVDLSMRAAEVLNEHSRVRVMLPLEDDQIQVNTDGNHPEWIDPATTSRLWSVSPGLVFPTPAARWPTGIPQPQHWLRTDQPELVPYVGAGGDERDVRVWAWLAFLRNAHLILWNSALPTVTNATQPGDPNELVWFYPGEWFGLDHPVPSLQLKWLRRAQEDYEYLWLARQRGEVIHALQMARLITKPVQIATGQYPDPIYAMMSGTSDPTVWPQALQLVARSILLHQAETPVDPTAQRTLYIDTLQWQAPQERPMLVGRTADWSVASWNKDGTVDKLKLSLGLDIYNASENTPGGNQLQWQSLPAGWVVTPQPVGVPQLQTYSIHRASIDGQFDTAKTSPAALQPSTVDFVDGFTQVQSPIHLVLPVAASDQREGPISIDGILNDWNDADALQAGPLVKMLSRPALQRQELQAASTPTRIYSAWARENFYLAFAVAGIEDQGHTNQNFVTYHDRRAWGEDLCEALIQPVYADNSVGDLLHVVVKPNGAQWVERKLAVAGPADAWEPLNGTGIRYAANTPGNGKWTGELAIPWSVIAEQGRGRPVLLRFNFTQHKNATGESATWAGPVDFGRDSAFMGVLVIRTFDPAYSHLVTIPGHHTTRDWDY